MLYKLQYLCGGGFAEGLGRLHPQDSAQVYAAGKDLVSLADAAGNAFSRQRNRIQAGCAFNHGSVHGNLVSGTYDDDFPNLHIFRMYRQDFPVPLYVCNVRTDVHEVRNGLPGASLGHFFEEFSHLEEQHDEDRLRELGLCAGHETDTQGSQGGDAHEEILTEGFTLQKALCGLLERIPAHNKIRYQKQQQILPGFPAGILLYDYRCNQKYGCNYYFDKPSVPLFLLVMMVMVPVLFMAMLAVCVFFHSFTVFLLQS